ASLDLAAARPSLLPIESLTCWSIAAAVYLVVATFGYFLMPLNAQVVWGCPVQRRPARRAPVAGVEIASGRRSEWQAASAPASSARQACFAPAPACSECRW